MKTLGNVQIAIEIKISIEILIFQVMTKVVFFTYISYTWCQLCCQ